MGFAKICDVYEERMYISLVVYLSKCRESAARDYEQNDGRRLKTSPNKLENFIRHPYSTSTIPR